MTLDRAAAMDALSYVDCPGGGNLVSRDLLRALAVQAGVVSFVIEVPEGLNEADFVGVRAACVAVLRSRGANQVRVGVSSAPNATRRSPTQANENDPEKLKAKPEVAPSLKFGGHPKKLSAPIAPSGVKRILAIGSGKGGVGKSTVSSNLAVALARKGRKVGLLDADIYGPSQPRMMGINKRPGSPDGKQIIPLEAHGVTLMSIGFMLDERKAVVWRGPMLMGALQQMLGQVVWGELDVLIVDLPPGTGDVQLTLCRDAAVSGAIIVSTPQDVALLDARKALDMFATLKTPVLGLIENMSLFQCPSCGAECEIFGSGGVEREAKALDVPLLGALPIDLETRISGDAGQPVALGDSPMARAYGQIAQGLIDGKMA